MAHRKKRAVFALLSVGSLWLLASCTPATSVESGSNPEPAGEATTSAAPGEEQTDAQPEDIIDRLFSPLDNAVTDINRDLNKGDADAPSGSNE